MTSKNVLERLGIAFRPFTKDDESAFSGVESENPEIGFVEIEDREGSVISRPVIAIILDGEKTSIVGTDRDGEPFEVRLTLKFVIGGSEKIERIEEKEINLFLSKKTTPKIVEVAERIADELEENEDTPFSRLGAINYLLEFYDRERKVSNGLNVGDFLEAVFPTEVKLESEAYAKAGAKEAYAKAKAETVVSGGPIDPSLYPGDPETFYRDSLTYANADRLLKGSPSIEETKRLDDETAIEEAKRETEITRFYSNTVDFDELGRSVRTVLGRSTNRDIYFLEVDNGTSDGVVLSSNLPISPKKGKDLLRFFEDLEIDFPDVPLA